MMIIIYNSQFIIHLNSPHNTQYRTDDILYSNRNGKETNNSRDGNNARRT